MTKDQIEARIVEIENEAFDRYVECFRPVRYMTPEAKAEYKNLKKELKAIERSTTTEKKRLVVSMKRINGETTVKIGDIKI